jgi:hypothetical protein
VHEARSKLQGLQKEKDDDEAKKDKLRGQIARVRQQELFAARGCHMLGCKLLRVWPAGWLVIYLITAAFA